MGVYHITNYLEEDAATWWRLHCAKIEAGTAAPITTWAQLKLEMVQRFQEVNRITAVRDDYSSLRQRGTVGKYVNRFRELVVELPDESEEQQVYQFLKGLKADIQRVVRPMKPTTVERAMDLADEAQRANDQADYGGFLSRQSADASVETPAAAEGDNATPMQLGAVNMTPGDKERCFREGLCFKCKKPGHAARGCRSRIREMPPEGGARTA